ncbi:hypothetical protein Tco_1561085 [Tanacetum coccineum]
MGSNEEIIQLLQKTQTIFKQTQRDKEEKYLNDIIQLQDKIKDLENVVCKMGRSTDTLRLLTSEQKAFKDNLHKSGVGYNGPFVLSQAYAKIPKLYRASELCDKNEQLHVFDYEETLEDAEKSQLKMNDHICGKEDSSPSSTNELEKESGENTCDNANSEFQTKFIELEKVLTQQTKDFDDVKLELSNRTAKFEAYFENLKKRKMYFELTSARKV